MSDKHNNKAPLPYLYSTIYTIPFNEEKIIEFEHIKYKKLCLDYCRELDHYFPKNKKRKFRWEIHDWFRQLYIWSICHLLPYSGQRKILCFIILKDGKAHNIDGYDYEIAEMYIEPSKRHRGLALQAAVGVLRKNKGKYILVILDANTGALKFWRKVAGELGTHLKWLDYLEFCDAGTYSKVYEIDANASVHAWTAETWRSLHDAMKEEFL